MSSYRLTLSQVQDLIAAGDITVPELRQDLMDRIATCEPAVQAWQQLEADEDLAEQSGHSAIEAAPPLAGVHVGVKDVIDVRGFRCEANSPVFRGRRPGKDAAVVRRLREAGVYILGKTVTCELATNDPSKTRNPWNLGHSPGASSAGSAAAVAAGMVPASLGTQTGGSVIRPAAYCGIIGYKPTYGRVPTTGVFPLSWSFDHVGFFARAVQDMAALLDVAEGRTTDALRDRVVPAEPVTRLRPNKPIRVAYYRGDVEKYVHPEVLAIVDGAAEILRSHDVDIVPERLPESVKDLMATDRTIIRTECAAAYYEDFCRDPDAFGEDITHNINMGLMVPGAIYLKAQRLRSDFATRLDNVLKEVDFAIMPATRDFAPKIDHTGDPLFNTPFSGAGTPVVTVPLKWAQGGLPCGLQMIGARGADRNLLAFAAWCEREFDWTARIADPASTGLGGAS